MLTRRTFLLAAATFPLAGQAHHGADRFRVAAEVSAVAAKGSGLTLSLGLTNPGPGPARLEGLYSDLGPVTAALPLDLPPGGCAGLRAHLAARDWPGIFTLILDFGAAGAGPVTVIPQ